MADETAELEALLMERSLTDEELLRATDASPDYRILPDAMVVKIGGQSVIDRGRAALYPLVDEIVAGPAGTPAADRYGRRHPGPAPLLDRR